MLVIETVGEDKVEQEKTMTAAQKADLPALQKLAMVQDVSQMQEVLQNKASTQAQHTIHPKMHSRNNCNSKFQIGI